MLAVLWLVWLVGAAAFGARVGHDAVDFNSPNPCAVPGHHAQFGTATWSWWPPGETCAGPRGGVFKAPPSWRKRAAILLAIGLVGVPSATVLLARRERDRGGVRSVGFDRLVNLVDDDDKDDPVQRSDRT